MTDELGGRSKTTSDEPVCPPALPDGYTDWSTKESLLHLWCRVASPAGGQSRVAVALQADRSRRPAELRPDSEFVQQAAAQLPWFHLRTLIDRLDVRDEREIESAPVRHVTAFLLEPGAGFTFVVRQVLLQSLSAEFQTSLPSTEKIECKWQAERLPLKTSPFHKSTGCGC